MDAAEHIPKNLQAAVAKLEDAIGKSNVKTSKMERLLIVMILPVAELGSAWFQERSGHRGPPVLDRGPTEDRQDRS